VGRDRFRHSRETRKHKSRIPCLIFGESPFPDPVNIFIIFPIPSPYFGQIPDIPFQTLSPGIATKRRATRLGNKATKRRQREEKKEVKKRRIQLKNERCSDQYQQTVREGTTYEKDIGLWHSSDVEGIPPTNSCNTDWMDSAINVVFAVETTSLGNYINLSVYLQAVSGLLKASKICVHTESYYMPNNTECRIIVILVDDICYEKLKSKIK